MRSTSGLKGSEMLNNDIIKIVGVKEITKDRLTSLLLLYKEVLEYASVDLYLSFVCLKHDHYYTVDNFLKTVGIKAARMEDAMHDLERNDLIRTYHKPGEYMIEVIAPKDAEAFFADEVLTSYAQFKNRDRLAFLKEQLYKDETNKEGYRDISEKRVGRSLSYDVDEKIDAVKRKYIFPIERLMDTTSTVLWPKELRTYNDLNRIAKLGELYNISIDDMRKYLNRSIVNGPDVYIDYQTLERYCLRGEGTGDQQGFEYEISPMVFLAQLRNVKNLTADDKMMIRNLASDDKYGLRNAVINVLLEYVYRRFGSNLNRSMVYSIANEWHYKDIDNAEKAKNAIKEHTLVNKVSSGNKEDVVPVYDDSNNPVMSKEDMLRYKKYIQGDGRE